MSEIDDLREQVRALSAELAALKSDSRSYWKLDAENARAELTATKWKQEYAAGVTACFFGLTEALVAGLAERDARRCGACTKWGDRSSLTDDLHWCSTWHAETSKDVFCSFWAAREEGE
jgi:hypothetical protein